MYCDRVRRPQPIPDFDWPEERARRFADQVLDLWIGYLEALPGLPVSRPITPTEVRRALLPEVPERAMSDEDIFSHLRTLTGELSTQTGHGGWMGYITGAGTVPGAQASLLAAGVNQNLGGWPMSPGATELETQLLGWFATKLGLPASASGAFVSGGATANLMALAVARDFIADWDVRGDGVAAGGPFAIYVSDDAHETIDRAADLLGLGSHAVRRVATDRSLRVSPRALEEAIAKDTRAGIRPLAVVGTAGTTETGSIDPLGDLAEIAHHHDCWFHVDAAYGGPAAMVDRFKPRFRGLERADSVTIDPHKWLNAPIPSSLVLISDPARQLAAFTLKPDYVQLDAALEQDMMMRYQWTPQFSRPFDALGIWVSLLAHGWDSYQRRISHDIDLAAWLQYLVEEHHELESLTDPELSIVCFRYVPPDLTDSDPAPYLDDLNEQTLYAVQRSGKVYPTNAVVDGRFAIRACLIGYRTEAEHVETLIDQVVYHGRLLHDERRR